MWMMLLTGCWLSTDEFAEWRAAADTGDGSVEKAAVLETLSYSFIQAGTFEMGCTSGQSNCEEDEEPAHTVTLTTSFWMTVTELTQDQYQALMGDNPSDFSSCGDCPVENISWHQAALATNALSEFEGRELCYSCSDTECEAPTHPYACAGYRLPTEAEWEFAARCGEDLLYAGSNDLDEVGWYRENSAAVTHYVAEKAANDCGLYDMSGNVWEWVNDWYNSEYYSVGDSVDPTGDPSGSRRVFRGGGWGSYEEGSRVSDRADDLPSDRYYTRGMRLVISDPG